MEAEEELRSIRSRGPQVKKIRIKKLVHERGLESAEKEETHGFGGFGLGASGEESYGDLSKYSNLGIKRVKCFKRSEGGCPFESEFSSEETWFSST